MATEAIKIKGLAEFNRNLRKLDSDLPKALRVALNQAADVVVDAARPRRCRAAPAGPQRRSRRSTRTAARVKGGGARVPYYPWLDFGGERRAPQVGEAGRSTRGPLPVRRVLPASATPASSPDPGPGAARRRPAAGVEVD
jgi:hypothetical protein